jgi:hypothetical protein
MLTYAEPEQQQQYLRAHSPVEGRGGGAVGDVGEEGGEDDSACAGAAFKSRCSRMLTYAHVCSRMLTYADVCSKKRRSEWEKKAHY